MEKDVIGIICESHPANVISDAVLAYAKGDDGPILQFVRDAGSKLEALGSISLSPQVFVEKVRDVLLDSLNDSYLLAADVLDVNPYWQWLQGISVDRCISVRAVRYGVRMENRGDQVDALVFALDSFSKSMPLSEIDVNSESDVIAYQLILEYLHDRIECMEGVVRYSGDLFGLIDNFLIRCSFAFIYGDRASEQLSRKVFALVSAIYRKGLLEREESARLLLWFLLRCGGVRGIAGPALAWNEQQGVLEEVLCEIHQLRDIRKASLLWRRDSVGATGELVFRSLEGETVLTSIEADVLAALGRWEQAAKLCHARSFFGIGPHVTEACRRGEASRALALVKLAANREQIAWGVPEIREELGGSLDWEWFFPNRAAEAAARDRYSAISPNNVFAVDVAAVFIESGEFEEGERVFRALAERSPHPLGNSCLEHLWLHRVRRALGIAQ